MDVLLSWSDPPMSAVAAARVQPTRWLPVKGLEEVSFVGESRAVVKLVGIEMTTTAECRARQLLLGLTFLSSAPNFPTRIFLLALRSGTRPNTPLEYLFCLCECAPDFEALSRPSGTRDSRVSLAAQ